MDVQYGSRISIVDNKWSASIMETQYGAWLTNMDHGKRVWSWFMNADHGYLLGAIEDTCMVIKR